MLERLRYWPARKWAWVLVVLVLFGLILYVVITAWAVLTPFFVGLVLAWILIPIVKWVEWPLRRVIRRPAAARLIAILLTYIAILLILGGIIYFLAPIVSAEFQALLDRLPAIIRDIRSALSGLRGFYNRAVPLAVQQYLSSLFPAGGLLSLLSSLFRGTTANLGVTLIILFGYIVLPFWLIYVVLDAERTHRGFLSIIPPAIRSDVENLGHIANGVASAYLRSQLIVAAITGVLTALALRLLGVDFAILLGLLTGVLDLIPTFGPILSAIPIAIIATIQRPILALWALLAVFGIRELEDLFLGPRIVGNLVRIRPVYIIVLLIAAGYIWGLLGLFLIVPIVALLRDMVDYLYLRTWAAGYSSDEALRIVHERQNTPLL